MNLVPAALHGIFTTLFVAGILFWVEMVWRSRNPGTEFASIGTHVNWALGFGAVVFMIALS